MLTIRKEQMDLFERAAVPQFEYRVIAHAEQRFPEDALSMGSDGLLDLVRYTVKSGAKYGIRDEGGLKALLELYIEFGRGLELAPYRHWAIQILNHRRLPGPMKVGLIRNRLSALTQGRRINRHVEDEQI